MLLEIALQRRTAIVPTDKAFSYTFNGSWAIFPSHSHKHKPIFLWLGRRRFFIISKWFTFNWKIYGVARLRFFKQSPSPALTPSNPRSPAYSSPTAYKLYLCDKLMAVCKRHVRHHGHHVIEIFIMRWVSCTQSTAESHFSFGMERNRFIFKFISDAWVLYVGGGAKAEVRKNDDQLCVCNQSVMVVLIKCNVFSEESVS